MKRIIFFVMAVGLIGCGSQLKAKFQVSGWNLGNPVHQNVKFSVNGDFVGQAVKFGQSSGTYEVEVVVGQASSSLAPSSSVQSTNITLAVVDSDTNVVIMTTQCYLTKNAVTNFMYERKSGTDSLYCR